jgi:hypothetical protein
MAFGQPIESINSTRFAGKNVVLSFYARSGANFSSATSILTAQVTYGTGNDQNYRNGFTGNTVVVSSPVTLTTSWQRFTISGNVNTAATQLGVQFSYTPVGTAGAADHFEITGVQLEEGLIATPFEQRPVGTELALCQRYYERASGVAASPFQMFTQGGWDSATTFSATWIYTTPKRVSPSVFSTTGITCLYHGIAWLNASSVASYTEMSLYGVRINYAVTGSATRGESGVAVFNSATAYVEASAEL